MTLLSKATRLIESLTELPNAAMACVEMAREAEHFRRLDATQYNLTTNATETTRLRACVDNLTGHCNVLTEEKNEAIADKIAAMSRCERAEAKLAAIKAELNREMEARRRRKQSDEPCPFSDDRLIGWSEGALMSSELSNGDTWYYLSPEDMP